MLALLNKLLLQRSLGAVIVEATSGAGSERRIGSNVNAVSANAMLHISLTMIAGNQISIGMAVLL
jgi:hypothetical protein